MLLRATRFGDLRRRTLSWCRSTRTSASNATRGRNSPIKAHQINLQRSLIDGTIDRFAGISQLFLVCGRDTPRSSLKAGFDLRSIHSMQSRPAPQDAQVLTVPDVLLD